MATGHTHPVIDGEITTVSEFAYECSRSFVWSWRDGNGLRYPEDRSAFYFDELKDNIVKLDRWNELSEEQKYAEWSEYVIKQEQRQAEDKKKSQLSYDRCMAILHQLETMTPPDTHKDFHEFMVQQLTDTAAFDGTSNDQYYRVQDFYEWCDNRLNEFLRMIKTYSAEAIKAKEAHRESVMWIDTLSSVYGVRLDS